MSSSSSSSGKWGKGCGSCHLTDANVSTDALAKDVVTQGTEAREKVEGYGKHCAECRQLDFLAVECSGCELWFCGAHGLSHQLSCADAASAASLRKGTSFDSARSRATDEEGNAARATKPKVKRCKKSGCRKAIGLVSHTCARCALSFCMAHRFQTDHDCASASTTHGSSRTPAQSCAAEAARSRVAVARAPQRTTQQVY